MKTKSILMMAALTGAMTLTGCASDNDNVATESPNFPADGVIRVVTKVESPTTRAGVTTDNLSMFYMNVAGATDTYSYYAMMGKFNANMETTTDWHSYIPDSSTPFQPLLMLWKDKTTPIEITAVAEIGALITQENFKMGTDFSVDADQTESHSVEQSDLLYMPETSIDPTKDITKDGKITVKLGHRLSKLSLTVVLGTEFNQTENGGTATNPITAVAVKGTNIHANFIPATNVLTLRSTPLTDVTPFALTDQYKPGSGTTTNAEARYECILVPQITAANTFAVSITVGGKEYKWTSAGAVTLEPGQMHNLKLLAGKDIVTLGNFSVSPWGDGNGEGQDVATE